ncbi:MAG: hypothetical protein ACK57K_08675 [Chryseotalea sp.]|jgi:hypothetical protein
MKITVIILLAMGLFNNLFGQKNNVKEYLKNNVKSLRNVGLFEEYSSLTIDQLTQKIIELEINYNGDFYEDEFPKNDLKWTFINIAKHDKRRVRFIGIEYAYREEKVYEQLIAEFKNMAPLLNPENCKEYWESEDGPIIVTFNNLGKEIKITPKFNDGWVDMKSILESFNSIIHSSGQKFEVLHGTDDQLFIIRLSENEKEIITKLFKIQFK